MSANPAFPTSFNNTAALTDYAKAVGMVFGGFGIVAILLSMVMICIFIKFCCTSPKDSQEFKKKIHLAIAVGLSVIAVVGCGVGWGYNKQCNDGVTTMTGSVSNLFNSSANLIDSIDLTIVTISAALDAKTQDIANIPFSGLLIPINQTLRLIDQMQARTNGLYALTTEAVKNVTIMKDELDFINSQASSMSPPLNDVPSSSDIPNIDTSFEDSIKTGNNSINDMRNTTLSVKQTVSDSVSNIANNLIGNLNEQTDSYHQKVGDLTNSFDDMRDSLDSYEGRYNKDYKPTVNKYSVQRTAVVNAILILPIVVGLLSGVGVFFRMPKVLSITCALSFICFFWYVLIAGVNYTLYVVSDGFCKEQSTIVNAALANMNSKFTVPGTNNSYSTGEKVGELIQCSGDTTLIGVFEVGFLITDLETQVRLQAQNISNQAHSMSFGDDYRNATADLNNYKNNTVDLDYAQGKDLVNVTRRLDNAQHQLNHTMVEQREWRDTNLSALNAITTDTSYTNGTAAPSIYYTLLNFSLFACDDQTWNDTVQQIDLCDHGTRITVLNTLLVVEVGVYTNVSDVEEKVLALQTDIKSLNSSQVFLKNTVTQVQGLLDSAYGLTNGFIADIDNGVAAIYNVITDGADTLEGDTNCAFVGKFYSDFSGGFCQKLSPSLRVIAAMMMLGSTTLFGSAVLSAVSIYKIKGSGEDDDYEMDSKSRA